MTGGSSESSCDTIIVVISEFLTKPGLRKALATVNEIMNREMKWSQIQDKKHSSVLAARNKLTPLIASW